MNRLKQWIREVNEWWFDLDGTLIHPIPYSSLLRQISRITLQNSGWVREQQRVQFCGFDDALCTHLLLARNEGERSLIRLAHRRFITQYGTPIVVDGAFDVLEILRQRKKKIVCYTRGHQTTQLNKLRQTGLLSNFDEILVVEKKDAETFDMHVARCPGPIPPNVVVIGNTYAEDIMPAKDLCVGRVWVTDTVDEHVSAALYEKHDDIVIIPAVCVLLDFLKSV